jgi:hypothetical protein
MQLFLYFCALCCAKKNRERETVHEQNSLIFRRSCQSFSWKLVLNVPFLINNAYAMSRPKTNWAGGRAERQLPTGSCLPTCGSHIFLSFFLLFNKFLRHKYVHNSSRKKLYTQLVVYRKNYKFFSANNCVYKLYT